MIVLYVGDCIIISRTEKEADGIYKEINDKGYKMTDEGTMEEYLGILFTHNEDKGSFRMSQPHVINRIIDFIPGMKDVRRATTPAQPGEVLTKDENGEARREDWNYRSIIGMLNFLVNCTHPEMVYAVH